MAARTLEDFRRMSDWALSQTVQLLEVCQDFGEEPKRQFTLAMQAALERMPDYPDALKTWMAHVG